MKLCKILFNCFILNILYHIAYSSQCVFWFFQLLRGTQLENAKYRNAYLMQSLMLFEFNLNFEIEYLPLRHLNFTFFAFIFIMFQSLQKYDKVFDMQGNPNTSSGY